jgi:hypothetical protein
MRSENFSSLRLRGVKKMSKKISYNKGIVNLAYKMGVLGYQSMRVKRKNNGGK